MSKKRISSFAFFTVIGLTAVTCLQALSLYKSTGLVGNRDLSSISISAEGARNQDQEWLPQPLQIHAKVDSYIENHLPVPNNGLTKVYAKSSLMPGEDKARYVVITFANAEYFENKLISNWLCSLHSLGIDNFVVVPIDEEAAKAALEMGDAILPEESIYWDPNYWTINSNSKKRKNSSFSGSLRKGTKPTEIFIEFIWRRAQLVHTLLKRHPDLNIVLSDADTTWARRPWDVVPAYFNQTNSCDMFLANDIEYGVTDEPLRTVEPLSGFIMIRNRDVVLDLYQKWIKAALVFHNKDQPSMRAALQTFKMKFLVESAEYDEPKGKYPLVLCTLDREYFPTIQFIQTGLYAKRYQNRTNSIALYHPNFADKKRKPSFFKDHHQWYLDFSNKTCVTPTDATMTA